MKKIVRAAACLAALAAVPAYAHSSVNIGFYSAPPPVAYYAPPQPYYVVARPGYRPVYYAPRPVAYAPYWQFDFSDWRRGHRGYWR